METVVEVTIPVEVKKRGIITIPEATRKFYDIEEGSILLIKVEKVINK